MAGETVQMSRNAIPLAASALREKLRGMLIGGAWCKGSGPHFLHRYAADTDMITPAELASIAPVDVAIASAHSSTRIVETFKPGDPFEDAMEAGSAVINGSVGLVPQVPFGGVGISGYGKEGGRVGERAGAALGTRHSASSESDPESSSTSLGLNKFVRTKSIYTGN